MSQIASRSMPTTNIPVRRIGVATTLLLLHMLMTGCASVSMNETAYQYTLNEEKLENKPLKLILATENFGVPSKTYLQKYESTIDAAVSERLGEAGYTLLDNQSFATAWRQAVRKHGSPVDASQSQINRAAFRRVVAQTFQDIGENTDADAIVFTDLVEQLVVFSGSNNRKAKWDGVSRTPRIKGGNQISASFDWSQTVPAVSLRVIVYSTEGHLLFKSFGGLELSRQLDTQRERFVRRSELFQSRANVKQGVGIALHPFIPFD